MNKTQAKTLEGEQHWEQLLDEVAANDSIVYEEDELEDTNGHSSISTATSISDIEESLNTAEQVLYDNTSNPIAKLDGTTDIIGLDQSSVIPPNLFSDDDSLDSDVAQPVSNELGSIQENIDESSATTIVPSDFLPPYQGKFFENNKETEEKLPATKNVHQQSILQSAKNRLFNKKTEQQPKVFATLHVRVHEENSTLESENRDKSEHFELADTNVQPYKNIEAALENIYQDTVIDFTAALPTLRKVAQEAAKAVGYFDVKMSFQQPSLNEVAVIIESIGEPVVVDSRVIEIRGEGSELEIFQDMEDKLPPKSGSVFNQSEYQTAKTKIENSSNQLGFFDSSWLNSSADVILPDNIADVDLVYNTGKRYEFDEVVFFTIDEKTGKLTTDPNKLPVKYELLQRLVGFNKGEGYNRSKVNKLRNDLATTRYFNNINIEEVMPSDNTDDNSGIEFENIAEMSNPFMTEPLTQSESKLPVDVALVAFPNMPSTGIDNLKIESVSTDEFHSAEATDDIGSNRAGLENNIIDSLINTDLNDSQADEGNIDGEDIETQKQLAAITFSIDDSTNDKYQAIETKANNLLSLPDDRVLNERTLKAENTLGKIMDAVSTIAKNILPEQSPSKILLEDEQLALANKKTPEQVREDKKVPLYILVMSNKPYDAQIGFGYGTDRGFRTTAKLDNNLINRDGYKAGISAEWSDAEKKAGVYVSRPWKHPLDDTLSANLSYEETKINKGNADNDWNTKSVLAGVARNRFSDNNWNRSYSLRYRYDELDIGDDVLADPDDVPIRFSSSNPKQQAVLLGYSMHKTTVDDLTNPKFGMLQRYSLEAGLDSAGTDTDMAIARVGVSGIYSFGDNNRHQVLGKLNTGYLWADDFYNVPYPLRFFAGGDQSIRGYDYNSLSPVDNGYLTGGQILAVGSTEYNYEFKKGLRGAVFADVGNAYDEDFTTPTKLGVGFGIRWASPVGPVRVDVGAGVTEDSIPVRLHLFIGSPL